MSATTERVIVARHYLVRSIVNADLDPHVQALAIKLNQVSLIDAIHREASR